MGGDDELVGGRSARALELHHMFAFELDCYDYTAHVSNESMNIADRLYCFSEELKKPPNYNDPTSIMNSAAHRNDDDACRLAGLGVATCVPARTAAHRCKTVAMMFDTNAAK
jgi:hypothetical protein